MRKLSFLALAAVGLLFGACASNDVVDEQTQDPLQGRDGGFINVGIVLPTKSASATRAWSEEDKTTPILDPGSADEYAVQNVLLLIFSGSSETAAQLKQVEVLTPAFNNVADDPDQITQNSKHAVKLDATTADTYVGALAILNYTGIVTKINDYTISVLGSNLVSPKIGDLQDKVAEAETDGSTKFIYKVGTDKYFFMTNAVLSDTRGGEVAPTGAATTVLAPVDLTTTYATAEDAMASTSVNAEIFVERGVAKATISAGTDFLKIGSGLTKGGASYTTAGTFQGWCLDNTNKRSYFVRRVDVPETSFKWDLFNTKSTADKYRFVGMSSVDKFYTSSKENTQFRTYWAKDPNYSTDYTDTELQSEFYVPGTKTFVSQSTPLYCYENTFDVKHQSYKNTTRAIIHVKLNGGTTFYTVDNNQTVLYDEADMQDLIKSLLLSSATFNTWYAANGSGVLNKDNIELLFDKSAGVVKLSQVTIKKANLNSSHTVDFVFNNTTTALAGVIENDVNNYATNIKRYENGDTYYVIRIKHFGDDLTPWNKGEYSPAPTEATIANIYPDFDAASYLGRYGMVRNNWYYLEINKILKVGHPTVPNISPDPSHPEDPGTPDDPDDPTNPDHPDDTLDDVYIQARINILSWAKRPQTWNLK